MSALRELQHSFARAICDADRTLPRDVISHVTCHPERRFNVYRNNSASSLVDVLEAYFPVVSRLVGHEFFRTTARAFVASRPPRSPILSRYGAEFPAFLETYPAVEDVPYLPDVARLEWLRQRAYHAADAPALSGKELARLPSAQAGDITFRSHPSTALLVSPYPVVSIWRTNAQDEVVHPIDALSGGEFALIVRPKLTVYVIGLCAGGHALAAALLDGKSLGTAVAEALRDDPRFDLQGTLAMLIEHGAFVGVWLAAGSQQLSEIPRHG